MAGRWTLCNLVNPSWIREATARGQISLMIGWNFRWMAVFLTPGLPSERVFGEAVYHRAQLNSSISTLELKSPEVLFGHLFHKNAGIFCSKVFSLSFLPPFLCNIYFQVLHCLLRPTSLLNLWSFKGEDLTLGTRRSSRACWVCPGSTLHAAVFLRHTRIYSLGTHAAIALWLPESGLGNSPNA